MLSLFPRGIDRHTWPSFVTGHQPWYDILDWKSKSVPVNAIARMFQKQVPNTPNLASGVTFLPLLSYTHLLSVTHVSLKCV